MWLATTLHWHTGTVNKMVLFLIGLGLGDEKDITVRGLEIVKSCSKLFLEAYTSILVDAQQHQRLVWFF